MRQPFDYQQILYNEVIDFLEQKWQRKLTEHEKHIAIECYRFGRLVESENEIKIISVK